MSDSVQVLCGNCHFPLSDKRGATQDCPYCNTTNIIGSDAESLSKAPVKGLIALVAIVAGFVILASGGLTK